MSLSKRARRIWIFLISFGLMLAVGAWWVNKQLEPTKLTNTVLGKMGEQLDLKFEFKGLPSYAMKPEPRLILPNLKAINPVDNKIFLSAKRVEISLPWSTILGDTPHITRIEADDAVLDFPGLRAWQATRPVTPFEVPTFTSGLEINNGQVIDAGFSITKINASLPHLEDQEPLSAKVSGIFQQDKTRISFNGPLNIAKAGLNSEFTLEGKGELNLGDKPLPYQFKTNGNFASLEKSFDINSKTLSWISESPLPNLQASLNVSIGDTLKLNSSGVIAQWPKEWPVLPAPLNKQTKNIPYELNYSGKADFSDAVLLKLSIEKSRLSSSLKIADIQQWVENPEGTPLPPLQGQFDTPIIQLDGVTLEGVSIEITPDAVQ
jgi:uncharacterized protein involved in outer membrane biogenesis